MKSAPVGCFYATAGKDALLETAPVEQKKQNKFLKHVTFKMLCKLCKLALDGVDSFEY